LASSENEMARGHQAARILNDGMYQEAFTAVRERIIALLESAELPDDKRQRVNDLLVALKQTKKYMEQVMQGGKMAAEQIERERTFGERVKQSVGL
jgi:hypothetical protein